VLPDETLFWSHVDRSGGPDACWPWTARLGTTGYGAVSITRTGLHKTFKAHRIAWQFVNGEIPDGLFLCHRCDNRPCCNTAHMFPGTPADNVADMISKGRRVHVVASPERRARGETHGRAKLNATQVLDIRERASTGALQRSLAREFGVGQATISKIVTRQKWADLVSAQQGVPPNSPGGGA